jgi:hypothetical protein
MKIQNLTYIFAIVRLEYLQYKDIELVFMLMTSFSHLFSIISVYNYFIPLILSLWFSIYAVGVLYHFRSQSLFLLLKFSQKIESFLFLNKSCLKIEIQKISNKEIKFSNYSLLSSVLTCLRMSSANPVISRQDKYINLRRRLTDLNYTETFSVE